MSSARGGGANDSHDALVAWLELELGKLLGFDASELATYLIPIHDQATAEAFLIDFLGGEGAEADSRVRAQGISCRACCG